MTLIREKYLRQNRLIKDNGVFPNNNLLPVILYKGILDLPLFSPAQKVRNLFHENNWKNSWVDGIYDYHHYHSNTHEALGIIKGNAIILLGGDNGASFLL